MPKKIMLNLVIKRKRNPLKTRTCNPLGGKQVESNEQNELQYSENMNTATAPVCNRAQSSVIEQCQYSRLGARDIQHADRIKTTYAGPHYQVYQVYQVHY